MILVSDESLLIGFLLKLVSCKIAFAVILLFLSCTNLMKKGYLIEYPTLNIF